MTPRPLTTSWTAPDRDSVRVRLDGDLDFDTADTLLREVIARLPTVRALHLDMSTLGFCDSYGLSTLLMIRRHVDAADACLHLENRPAGLDRILRITNTLNHLTGSTAEAHQQTPRP
ncbi:anti-sigma-factor antagonist [Actinokineospora spheciospongiae]|uniref:Anti-sigma-factor antagonist n=1 Tax=Actinokineospora spheciospongiae TaxID=909613 RepID=W7J104_9PSEU|nr:STAS domain-containing protein [Actinokineospora spheciospongiae]EWC62581.1 anti-sigma-factor antagonist [Actinokineospora spheciospongiae]PWW62363.1 anti-anti-sigma factor [Actinokineospora spheciospongiae]